MIIGDAPEVLEALQTAVSDGLRRARSRDEHIRWSTVQQHLDELRDRAEGASAA